MRYLDEPAYGREPSKIGTRQVRNWLSCRGRSLAAPAGVLPGCAL